MDLSKAFDCLLHAILTAKLSAYGLSELSAKLMENYLTERKQSKDTRLTHFCSEQNVKKIEKTHSFLFRTKCKENRKDAIQSSKIYL